MSNLNVLKTDKQILVSRSDLSRLIGFYDSLQPTFNELNALFGAVADKSADHTPAKHLSRIGQVMCSDWADYCLEEQELAARLANAVEQSSTKAA